MAFLPVTVRYLWRHSARWPSLMIIVFLLVATTFLGYIHHQSDNVRLKNRSTYFAEEEPHSTEQIGDDVRNRDEKISLASPEKKVRPNLDDEARPGMRGKPVNVSTDVNASRMLTAFTLRNQLPNYFIHGHPSGLDEQYRTGNVVFAHNVKTGGTTIKDCLEDICRGHHIPIVLIDSRNRVDMFKKYEKEGGTPNQTIFNGDGAYCVCEYLRGRSCSYFTMVREPVSRLISDYLFCQQYGTDCTKSSVNVSIEAWALYWGSRLFNNLFWKFNKHYPLVGTRTGFQHRSAQFRVFAHQLHQDYPEVVTGNELCFRMTYRERSTFLSHCLKNMENWFSVVGLTEDFDLSLDLFQEVYRLPFRNYYHGAKNVGSIKKGIDPSEIDKMKKQLLANPLIMEALYEDLKIYEKAKEIMNKQKRVFRSL